MEFFANLSCKARVRRGRGHRDPPCGQHALFQSQFDICSLHLQAQPHAIPQMICLVLQFIGTSSAHTGIPWAHQRPSYSQNFRDRPRSRPMNSSPSTALIPHVYRHMQSRKIAQVIPHSIIAAAMDRKGSRVLLALLSNSKPPNVWPKLWTCGVLDRLSRKARNRLA